MSERTKVQISDIVIGDRHRKDNGDLAGLASSLESLGMLQPVGLTPANVLVFGGRRIEAAKSLGWEEVPFVVIDTVAGALALLQAERDENHCRKPMTKSEMVALGKAIEEIEKPKAAKKRASGLKKGKQSPVPVPEPERENVGETRENVGEALGVGGRTYEQMKKVVEQGSPELVAAMDAGEISVKKAAQKVAEKVAEEAKPESEPESPAAELIGGINRVCRMLDGAKSEVKKLSSDPFGRHIHSESVIAQIEAARKALWQARPTEPCNCVKGGATAKPECKACFGQGITCAGRVLKGGR